MKPRLTLVALSVLLSSSAAFAVKCPNIMLVLDKTGSMRMDPNGGTSMPSKWMLLQQAVTTILNAYGQQVPFGCELYSSNANDDQGCYNDTMIDIEPKDGTAAMIAQLVNAAMPGGGTNTGEAIKRARIDPAMMDTTRGDYIILITDGDPNCNSGDQNGNATYSISEITNAFQQSPTIHTFVIGFDGSGGVNPANLNAMAMAGGEPRAGCNGMTGNQCYYSANNAQALNDALNTIVNQVTGGGEFGTTTCDDSCITNGCPMGQICTTDEINTTPHCAPDPCAGVMCPTGQYCRAGTCQSPCVSKCDPGMVCEAGQCVQDPCFQKNCMNGQVCNPQNGACIANPCTGVMCPAGTACDVTTGKCAADPCRNIVCPMGTMCVTGGNCESTSASMGGCGCLLGARPSDAGLGLATISLLALALGTRIRRKWGHSPLRNPPK
jgi:hypothetical protein